MVTTKNKVSYNLHHIMAIIFGLFFFATEPSRNFLDHTRNWGLMDTEYLDFSGLIRHLSAHQLVHLFSFRKNLAATADYIQFIAKMYNSKDSRKWRQFLGCLSHRNSSPDRSLDIK